ncbi:hypothetical protein B9Z65_4862 [Elsinoe australis]|uniref:Uncharacterized protein n=1 Tax=Elsinoe australis TaxID=40998 RepID=A0A2P8A696_9PEZI|nr:hypothetical protein B9Z65_4862 [Elsinoe australis]
MSSPITLTIRRVQGDQVTNPFIISGLGATIHWMPQNDGKLSSQWRIIWEVHPMGPGPERPKRSYHQIHAPSAATSHTFPPDIWKPNESSNLFVRFWSDGRIAAGTFIPHPKGGVELLFGVAVMPVEVNTLESITNQTASHQWNDLVFRVWYIAGAGGQDDRTAFAAQVYEYLSQHNSLFSDCAT